MKRKTIELLKHLIVYIAIFTLATIPITDAVSSFAYKNEHNNKPTAKATVYEVTRIRTNDDSYSKYLSSTSSDIYGWLHYYRFKVSGIEYEGSYLTSIKSAKKGETITIHYNKDKPQFNYYLKYPTYFTNMIKLSFGLFIIIFSAFLVWCSYHRSISECNNVNIKDSQEDIQ